jgi:hypothetical protein
VFAIVTHKPGEFHTELGEHVRVVETYDYVFCGRTRAQFAIAEMDPGDKVRIVEESGAQAANAVPAKFLPRYEDIQSARRELGRLVRFGTLDAKLVRR